VHGVQQPSKWLHAQLPGRFQERVGGARLGKHIRRLPGHKCHRAVLDAVALLVLRLCLQVWQRGGGHAHGHACTRTLVTKGNSKKDDAWKSVLT
jgi:hypothetical protein